MILKLNEIDKKIEYLELNKMKSFIKDNMKSIFDDILSNKNIDKIELEKELKFDNIKSQELLKYNIENKKSKLYIHKLNQDLYFILREIELNNYYEKNLLKEIKSLKDNQEIKNKLDEFNFMIIEYKEKSFIILFHNENDFKIKK